MRCNAMQMERDGALNRVVQQGEGIRCFERESAFIRMEVPPVKHICGARTRNFLSAPQLLPSTETREILGPTQLLPTK